MTGSDLSQLYQDVQQVIKTKDKARWSCWSRIEKLKVKYGVTRIVNDFDEDEEESYTKVFMKGEEVTVKTGLMDIDADWELNTLSEQLDKHEVEQFFDKYWDLLVEPLIKTRRSAEDLGYTADINAMSEIEIQDDHFWVTIPIKGDIEDIRVEWESERFFNDPSMRIFHFLLAHIPDSRKTREWTVDIKKKWGLGL
jgi:hypothetical protein